MASLSVESTRYTLKKLKVEDYFLDYSDFDSYEEHDNGWQRAFKYLVPTGNLPVDIASVRALDSLRDLLQAGISNDLAKYSLPESYQTTLSWSINARSLQNFISLRSDKAALWEIRNLANAVYLQLPSDHQYLFEDSLKEY